MSIAAKTAKRSPATTHNTDLHHAHHPPAANVVCRNEWELVFNCLSRNTALSILNALPTMIALFLHIVRNPKPDTNGLVTNSHGSFAILTAVIFIISTYC